MMLNHKVLLQLYALLEPVFIHIYDVRFYLVGHMSVHSF